MSMEKKRDWAAELVAPGLTQHVVWLDVVRMLAMFTLVCCHCANPFNWTPEGVPVQEGVKFWGAMWGSALRHSVPLFVMITGALLLPVRGDAGPFYKKRIGRVLPPFLIWSVAYCLFPWLLGLFGGGQELLRAFFPYAGADFQTQRLEVSVKHVFLISLNFSSIGIQMWYIYLLIGLYLYMPIFSAWVETATDGAKRWFLVAWLVTTLLPYYSCFADTGIWGTCSWNAFGMLYYFAGFNGYLLLGHCLRNCVWSWRQLVCVGIPMFAIGYAITCCGYLWLTGLPGCTEQMSELFWTTNSLNVVMMTVPFFMLCKVIPVTSLWVKRLLANLTLCGFGIYMIHYFFIGPAVLLVRALGCPLCVQIPLAAVIAFAVSWSLVSVAYRILGRKIRWLLG